MVVIPSTTLQVYEKEIHSSARRIRVESTTTNYRFVFLYLLGHRVRQQILKRVWKQQRDERDLSHNKDDHDDHIANQEDFDTTTSAAPSQHPHDDQEYPQPDQGPCQTTDHAGHRGDILKGFQHRGYEVSSHDNQRPGGDQRQSNELKQSRNVCRFREKFKEFEELKGIAFFCFDDKIIIFSYDKIKYKCTFTKYAHDFNKCDI